jgi:hypothetical protein
VAFQKGFVEVTVEVVAAPGCFLSSSPLSRRVPKGDPAIFVLTVQRLEGYSGPVYLQAVNLAGGHTIAPNPIPAGETQATLAIDTAGWQTGQGPVPIGIEGSDVPYPEE